KVVTVVAAFLFIYVQERKLHHAKTRSVCPRSPGKSSPDVKRAGPPPTANDCGWAGARFFSGPVCPDCETAPPPRITRKCPTVFARVGAATISDGRWPSGTDGLDADGPGAGTLAVLGASQFGVARFSSFFAP